MAQGRMCVLGALLLSAACGCASRGAAMRATPDLPVTWGQAPGASEGLWVRPLNDHSLASPEIRVDALKPEIIVSLLLVNRTSQSLFVAFEEDEWTSWGTLKVTTVTVRGGQPRKGKSFPGMGIGEGPGGGGGQFVLLLPAQLRESPDGPYPAQPCESSILLRFTITLSGYEAEYTDVEFAWPVVYYAMGSAEPNQVWLRRTMRIFYTPAESSPAAPSQ